MNNLLAAGLNENLAEIVGKLQTLMDSFWIYIVMALARRSCRVGCIRRNQDCNRTQERRKDQCS